MSQIESTETTIGIIGGGQLARMTAIAAYKLGIQIATLDPDSNSPAPQIAHKNVIGSLNDVKKLEEVAKISDVITLENEFVDAPLLEHLESLGVKVFPTSRTVGLIQDKLTQKRSMDLSGIQIPRFKDVSTPEDILVAGEDFGWPLILKVRRNAYDGRGNWLIKSPEDTRAAWNNLGGDNQKLMVESFIKFEKELAVMVVRSTRGEMAIYPVVETIQKNHICHIVKAPADINSKPLDAASNMAKRAIEAIEGIGIFGVELFLLENDQVMINEIAPRPHNSGHYTIEACVTSQYENHLRSVLGYPLGSTMMLRPAAVMVNLLGNREGVANVVGVSDSLEIPDVHVHIYCKKLTRKNRKMGHVTVIGATMEESLDKALKASSLISF